MHKKVLLVDTSFSSRPIYDALCEQGFEVHVVGRNPADTLAKQTKNFWQLDYSKVNLLDELIETQGFDYIIPGCTDLSYSACVHVNRGRFPGLESPENDQSINLKDRFRKLAKRLGVKVPKVFFECEEKLPYPVIVKPVDSYSGRGISVVEGGGDLLEAITIARMESVREKVIIEEYVVGQLYSHSAFIESGRVIQDFFVREDSIENPFAVDLSMVCPDMPLEYTAQMRFYIEAIVADLQLKNGLLHTQFIIGSDGCSIIEMTRRCPGDLYSRLIELQTGYEYSENYINSFVGKKPKRMESFLGDHVVIRHTVSAGKADFFNDIKCMPEVAICEDFQLYSKGEFINTDHSRRVGVIFVKTVRGDSASSLYKSFLKGNICKVI